MNAHRAGFVGAATAATALVLAAGTAFPTTGSIVPSEAHALGRAPITVHGVADERGLAKDAPLIGCAAADGVDWYTVQAPRRGPIVARLVARGELDGAIAVYRVVRSQRLPVLCAKTNRHGRARVAWYGYSEGAYLIGVARRTGSAPGPYDLALRVAQRAPAPPGPAMSPGGATGTINSVLNHGDAWSVDLERGVTYKLNLTSPKGCLGLSLYRPRVSSFKRATPVFDRDCGGYALFTPGIDGGGRYSLVVTDNDGDALDHYYRLRVAPAATDDTSPGIALTNGQYVTGVLDGRALDVVDLYRFDVARENELTTLDLHQRMATRLDLLILNETGGRVACACGHGGRQVLREHVAPGHYYAAIRAIGKKSGTYGLQLFVRDVTTTSISVNATSFAEIAPGSAVPLQVAVTSASHGGPVVIEIDRLDPLAGWQFSTVLRGRLDSSGRFTAPWVPPSVGQWRARARFVGTPFSSFSESGYVHLHVAGALE